MSAWSKDVPTAPGFYWCHQYGRTRMVSVWKYPGPGRCGAAQYNPSVPVREDK